MTNTRQLALDLPHRPAFARDDFIVSPANNEAVAWIDRWPNWPAFGLIVHGPPGCGKTHLAHVWQEYSKAQIITQEFLAGDNWSGFSEQVPIVVLDGIDFDVDERALLHLYNRLVEVQGTLLLTSRLSPDAWSFSLPDLSSRLRSLPNVTIDPPDDELLIAILSKLFSDRQLVVEREVLLYLVSRMERSFDNARACAIALDSAAFERRRNVTVALASEVLGEGPFT